MSSLYMDIRTCAKAPCQVHRVWSIRVNTEHSLQCTQCIKLSTHTIWATNLVLRVKGSDLKQTFYCSSAASERVTHLTKSIAGKVIGPKQVRIAEVQIDTGWLWVCGIVCACMCVCFCLLACVHVCVFVIQRRISEHNT
jgi:hypothetical protein